MKPTKEMIEETAIALAAGFKEFEETEYIKVEDIGNAAIDGYFDLRKVAEAFIAALPATDLAAALAAMPAPVPAVKVKTLLDMWRDGAFESSADEAAQDAIDSQAVGLDASPIIEAWLSSLSATTVAPAPDLTADNDRLRAFKIGEVVKKRSGSWWEGRVVGFYSTDQTADGVCVQLDKPMDPVQIYPAAALERKP